MQLTKGRVTSLLDPRIIQTIPRNREAEKPKSPVWGLLGKSASTDLALAQQASPAYHVTKDDPPLLIIHGDKDKTLFLEQSKRMSEEYRKRQSKTRRYPATA